MSALIMLDIVQNDKQSHNGPVLHAQHQLFLRESRWKVTDMHGMMFDNCFHNGQIKQTLN